MAIAKRKTSKRTKKMIYYFGKTKTEGQKVSKNILGGKGSNLAGMTQIGLPVPPGFTITTEVCDRYYKQNKNLPRGLMQSVRTNIGILERELNNIPDTRVRKL